MNNSTNTSKYICVEIIEDSDDSEIEVGFQEEEEVTKERVTKEKITKEKITKEKITKEKVVKEKVTKEKVTKEKKVEVKEEKIIECLLKKYYNVEPHIMEIGADEVGRGPMLGRVYSGAVVLPKDDSFDHYKMKDSKKFTSKNPKKINEVAEYIKEKAIAWAVEYEDEKVIDEINILQATQSAMHKAIKNVIGQLIKKKVDTNVIDTNNLFLLIDGNYFKPLIISLSASIQKQQKSIPYITIEGGDNKFTSIAAASILAKVERDKYIEQLCLENPDLIEKYGLDSNKGYGSKKHMDGIKKYGISKWHRRTFGICKDYV